MVSYHVVLVFANHDSVIVQRYINEAEKHQRSNTDSALILTDRAFRIALQSSDPVLLIEPYQAFANIYYYSGNQQLALDYYFKALRHLEENTTDRRSAKYIRTTAKIYNNIGNCYFDLKMTEIALAQYKKSLSIIEESNQIKPGIFTPHNKMLLMHNIGNVLASRNEFDSAKNYYQKAEEINTSVSNLQVKAGLLESFGIILLKEGHNTQALDYFTQALAVRERENDLNGIAGTYLFFGDYYRAMNEYSRAKEWYLKGMALGQKCSRWQIVQNAADNLTQLYLNARDFRKAFEMNRYSARLNDSIFNNKIKNNVTRLALQFEFDRQIKNQEIAKQKEIDNQRRRKVLFIFISVILFLMSILVVMLLINQRKKLINAKLKQQQLVLEGKNIRLENQNMILEREKLESELVQKNKELTTNVMYLVQKNEFITNIAQRAKELINNPTDQANQAFSNLVADLQRNTNDKFWKEFEVRFQDVHQDFYHRLNEKFPDLTPNEKKLAAFLRLNMSTKDISAITFQSTDSIRIARSRLRKKLCLPSDDNLIGFLEVL
jgi:tetratricopeptide (TPR) repeat protein